MTKEEKGKMESKYVGKKIKILNMEGEPQYIGKEGIVTKVDDIGQLHGTWGGCACNIDVDDIEIIG